MCYSEKLLSKHIKLAQELLQASSNLHSDLSLLRSLSFDCITMESSANHKVCHLMIQQSMRSRETENCCHIEGSPKFRRYEGGAGGGGGGGQPPLISSGLSIECDRRLHSILIAEFDIH